MRLNTSTEYIFCYLFALCLCVSGEDKGDNKVKIDISYTTIAIVVAVGILLVVGVLGYRYWKSSRKRNVRKRYSRLKREEEELVSDEFKDDEITVYDKP